MSPTILPVYYQIKQTIKSWITNKEFDLGEKIPSENELAMQFNVNKLTVRQAILQLVQEGFLVRKRGKGTFVTNNEHLINSFSLEFSGFMDDLFHQVSKSKTKSIEITKLTPSTSITEKLSLEKEVKEVIQIKRVRFLQDQSFAFTINYLPISIGEKIKKKDLYKKPLLQIMEKDLGIFFEEAFQTIEASFADQEVADQLGILSGTSILYIERIMYGKNKRPVEYVQSSFRGDLYKYIVRLKRPRGAKYNYWINQTV